MYINPTQPFTYFGILLWSIYYIFAVYISLYIPGRVILDGRDNKIGIPQRNVLSLGIGIIAWILQGLLFGILGIRWATYFYLGIAFALYIKNYTVIKDFFLTFRFLPKIPAMLGIIIGIGVLGQCIQSIPSGFIFPNGWYTFIADDSLWHLGLTGALIRDIPPIQPGLSGVPLTNYHFLSNLFIGEFIRIFHLPLFAGQFLFPYFLFSLLLGIVTYGLLRSIGITKPVSMIGVYLQYFASDLIYLTTYLTSRVFEFRVHPLEDGTMFLENPPRALATLLVLFGLSFYVISEQKKSLFWKILSGITFGLVIGAKVHTGLMVLLGLGAVGIVSMIRRDWKSLIVPLVSLFVSLVLYVPVNGGAGYPLISPFEMARTFVVQPLIHLSWLELRRQVYAAHGNLLRVFQMEMMMLCIFMISQFGIRNIGWLGIPFVFKQTSHRIALFLTGGLVGIWIFATVFIQPLTVGDTFNLYLAGSLILSILTAVTLNRMLSNKKRIWTIIVFLFIISITAPRWIYRMLNFSISLKQPKPVISREELQAAEYIKKNSRGSEVILVLNAGHWDSVWSYISTLAGRYSYLSGQHILDNTHIDYSQRLHNVSIISKGIDAAQIKKILGQENIDYIYAYKKNNRISEPKNFGLSEIYGNNSITIYKNEN